MTELYVSGWATALAGALGSAAPLTLMYASMPASRAIELPDRLSSRSNTGSAVVPEAGTLIITSWVLPAGRNTSLCTRDTPGRRLPSSATRLNPATVAAITPVGTTAGVVSDPTIDGTCIRRPALTKRTRTFPVSGAEDVPAGAVGNSEYEGFVLSNATPLIM